jgi:cyclopropane fatty-acyl-phospholipid synthase-like methyltransferase
LVQNEFDHAVIKLNIPFSKFGDKEGILAREIAAACKKLVYKRTIDLQINHDYLEKQQLLSFLSSNTINVFLYDDMKNRGISSATDWALAAGRPLAISRSRLFRHLFNCKPSICIDDNNLKTILANGVISLKHLWTEFSPEMVLWDYERIVADILKKKSKKVTRKRTAARFLLDKIFRKLSIPIHAEPIIQNTWTKVSDEFEFYEHSTLIPTYKQVILSQGERLNRILDDSARNTYKPAIDFMFKYFPVLIAKKIPEANVQQAFVMDTTVRLSKQFDNPTILAVGSFEDTAVGVLKLLNYQVIDIDPVLNYDLETFLTRPDIRPEIFDIVVSTSVIEHVKDDEQFVWDIASLLKQGGYAILTCDYKDQYVKGDDIPTVDYRFYTQEDIKNRLMRTIPDCELVDEAKWGCEMPDFYYLNRYNYTFASIVFMKSKSS